MNLPANNSGDQYNARVDYTMGRNTISASTFLTFFNNLSAQGAEQGRADVRCEFKALQPIRVSFLAVHFVPDDDQRGAP